MEKIFSLKNVTKRYEKFSLENVSFSLDKGCIMGFIGRNGAGKTTTLKSMLGLLRTDSGEVELLGKKSADIDCRQDIGFMLGGVSYYPKKKLSVITEVTRRFYKNWDEAAYRGYLQRFELDEDKKVDDLSEGMKVKYALALALSHKAKLLVLDEPTSGLDPVSRDDLNDLLRNFVADGEHGVLFSTQITSDLDKCADYITYIKRGRIIASTDKDTFVESYCILSGAKGELSPALEKKLIGCRKSAFGFEGMIRSSDLVSCEKPAGFTDSYEVSKPDLEKIMIHLER